MRNSIKRMVSAFVVVILSVILFAPFNVNADGNMVEVWYGDKVKNVTESEFLDLVSEGSIYLTAFEDVLVDYDWKFVTEGKTYKVVTWDTFGFGFGPSYEERNVVTIYNDFGLRHSFLVEGYGSSWESYTKWFTAHYYKED